MDPANNIFSINENIEKQKKKFHDYIISTKSLSDCMKKKNLKKSQ